MVVYSRRPGRNSVITRTHYKLCDTDTDHCIPFCKACTELFLVLNFVDIRVANSKTAYVVGYESELLNEHTEISQCDFPSHVELFKKVYNIQMNTPNTVPQTMTTSVFHVEASKLTTAAALVIYLWQDEDPEFFWDLVKDYFKNADKHETIARISMKKYKETGSYCLVVLLSKIPTEEILRSIRAMVRPYVGPCSAYFASNDLTAGVAMYTGIRLCYSDTTLTVTGSNRRAKFNSTIASEAHFHEAISKQNDGAIFRISRSFLNKNIIDEFNARVTAPMHGRRAVFEKIVRILFYSNNSWSDNIASIDLRSEDGQLKLTVMFRLLKEKDRQEVQEYVIDTVAKIYEELTGTNIVTGFSEVVNLPPRKHVLVTAEPKKEPVVETVAPTPKPKVSASGKKKSKKNRSLKTKTTNSAAKENVKDTSETVVEVSESVKKPVKRPEDMTKFESWLFDLTDDEFDMELEAFSKRLHPLNYTPETNYWKVMAFQDGEAMMEVINQFDSFSNSPENFARVIQEIFVNEQWKQSVDTLLLLFVNRNYMKAGPVIATASAMTCKFAWSSNNLIIMKKLMNRYVHNPILHLFLNFLVGDFDDLARVLPHYKIRF